MTAGIPGRVETAAGGEPLARDLHLERTGGHERLVDATGIAHVSEPDGASERVTVGGGGHRSHEATVSPDRLVSPRQRGGIVQDEADEPACRGALAPAQERLTAEEGH